MRNYKRGIMSTILAVGLCIVMGISGYAAFSETIDELEQEAENLRREAEALEAEREAAQAGRNVIDAELSQVIEEMIETSEQLTIKGQEVEAAEFELMNALVDENNQYQSMKRRIQFMFENGGFQMLELLFASESVAEFVNQVEYINVITTADRELLVEFEATVERVAEKEANLRAEQEILIELQNELIAQQDRLEVLLAEADIYLEDVHGRIGVNAAVFADVMARVETERELIRQAEEAAAAAAAAEAAAAAAAAEAAAAAAAEEELFAQAPGNPEYGTDGGYGTPEAPPPPPPPADDGGSWAMGSLFHPLPGAPMTSPFGPRWGTHHDGVDFGAPVGTPIFAAESGTVIISGFSHGGAGNWVVINHGGGLVTIYMHNSVNQVYVGQQVARGQQIALVGNTGFSTGPHLHFQVEINGVPVNPMQFL